MSPTPYGAKSTSLDRRAQLGRLGVRGASTSANAPSGSAPAAASAASLAHALASASAPEAAAPGDHACACWGPPAGFAGRESARGSREAAAVLQTRAHWVSYLSICAGWTTPVRRTSP